MREYNVKGDPNLQRLPEATEDLVLLVIEKDCQNTVNTLKTSRKNIGKETGLFQLLQTALLYVIVSVKAVIPKNGVVV